MVNLKTVLGWDDDPVRLNDEAGLAIVERDHFAAAVLLGRAAGLVTCESAKQVLLDRTEEQWRLARQR